MEVESNFIGILSYGGQNKRNSLAITANEEGFAFAYPCHHHHCCDQATFHWKNKKCTFVVNVMKTLGKYQMVAADLSHLSSPMCLFQLFNDHTLSSQSDGDNVPCLR